MSARMIMKNDYSKRSMPLNWGVSKSLTTSIYITSYLEIPIRRSPPGPTGPKAAQAYAGAGMRFS